MPEERELAIVAEDQAQSTPVLPLSDKNRQLEATSYMVREMQLAAMNFCDRVNRVVESRKFPGEHGVALLACSRLVSNSLVILFCFDID